MLTKDRWCILAISDLWEGRNLQASRRKLQINVFISFDGPTVSQFAEVRYVGTTHHLHEDTAQRVTSL